MCKKINRSFMLTPEQLDLLEELRIKHKYKTLSELIGMAIEIMHDREKGA